MKKYICSVCGYVYDEAKGIPSAGIAPGTTWEQLPDNWVCPLCGASKSEFREETADSDTAKPVAKIVETEDFKELSAMEMSIVCTNLAKSCEKQYKNAEAEQFCELGSYFKAAAPEDVAPSFDKILELIDGDLESGIPTANAIAAEAGDRGAMRALVWDEKVTRILKSLITRYRTEGDAWLDHTGVYVCTACGFIYVGDSAPELCPVCKVPSWKFEKIEGRV